MNIDIQFIQPPFSNEFIQDFIELNEKMFDGDQFADGIKWRLQNMPDVGVFVVKDCDKMIGVKAGYAVTYDRYHSWLGGIHPDYRQQGLAKKLMDSQHDWLRQTRFNVVETHVAQNNRNMIELNQKCGLSITGIYVSNEKPCFIMQKKIEK